MKKLAYITLIAACVFGLQPQEAFSTENNAIEMEKGGKGSVKILMNQNTEVLSLFISPAGKEKAQVIVHFAGNSVAKQTLMIFPKDNVVEIDLAGMSAGTYTVKVVSESIEFKENFRKK